MNELNPHPSHPEIVNRLKRTEGHLRGVLEMLESQRSCLDIAQQLHAIEKAIGAAKKLLIHDHIDHCLERAVHGKTQDMDDTFSEFKAITKYL